MAFTKLITSFAAVGLAVGSTMTLAAVPAAQAALPQGDGDLTAFAIDGNTTGPDDWDAPYGPGTTPQGNPTSGLLPFFTSASQFVVADLCDSPTDDIFKPSSKIDELVIDAPGPLTTGNIGQKKGDLCAAYAATELVDVDGTYHTVLYGAWQRGADPGEVSFFIPLADGTAGNGPGDRIVQFDYDSKAGGSTAASILTWNNGTWVQGDPLGTGVFQGATGPNSTPSFGEFAIDLTAAGVLPAAGPCTTLTAEYAFTRTGNSANATLEDYVGLPTLPVLTNCAEIVVDKVATPEPTNPTDFGFTVSQVDGGLVRPGSASLSGGLRVPSTPSTYPTPGDPVTIPNVLASPDYVVAETELPSGWTQDTLVCTGTNPLTGKAFTATLFNGEPGPDTEFPVGPGTTVTCTITNLGPPAVQLTKSVLPESNTDWSFTFTIAPVDPKVPTPEPASQPVTSTDPVIRWDGLTPGAEYTITETSTAGWLAGPVVCGTGEGAGSTFTAVAGELVLCTASNTQLAKLTVVKDADPADDTPFAFTASGLGEQGADATFTLTDPTAPQVVFDNLTPGGSTTITETLTGAQQAAGWTATTVQCVDAAYPGTDPVSGTVASTGANVNAPIKPGSDITCRFTNLKLASLSVTKSVLPADATGWVVDFTISPVPAGEQATKQASAGAPTVAWAGLVPGTTYTVTEGAMPGFLPGSLTCGSGGGSFTPTPGQAVSCAVTNTKLASVSVTKSVLPADLTDWSVTFTIFPAPPGVTETTKTATAAAPTVGWTGLLPGTTYTVSEGTMPGFTPGQLTCGAGTGIFTPAPGQVVGCSVTNTAEQVILPDEDVDEGTDDEVVGGTEEEIADTGADVLPLAAAALWATLLGGLLLLVSRRRRA